MIKYKNNIVQEALEAYVGEKDNAVYENEKLFYVKGCKLFEIMLIDIDKQYYDVVVHKGGSKWLHYKQLDGKIDGAYKVFYKDGSLQYKCNMVKGKVHGFAIDYFKDGAMMTRNKFINGIRVANES